MNPLDRQSDEHRPDLDDIRDRVIPIIAGYPHITGLSIFGSRSRGDFRDDSDYDMLALVDTDDDWESRRSLLDLECELSEEFGAPVGVYIAENHDLRWRRRIVSDLRWIWGERIDWSDVEPMTRDEAEWDRLAYQMEYVHHAFTVLLTEHHHIHPRFGIVCPTPYMIGPVNTLRNVQRHRPGLYSERFADLIPDAAALQDELDYLPSEGLLTHLLTDIFPEVIERAGMQLDIMGYERPGAVWDSGLHPPDAD